MMYLGTFGIWYTVAALRYLSLNHKGWLESATCLWYVQSQPMTLAALRSCHGDWRKALQLLEPGASIKSLGFCASICAKASQWPQSLQLLDASNAWDEVILCSSVLNACGKAQEWSQVLGVLHRCLEQRLKADTSCYNAAISGCAARWQWSVALLQGMSEVKLKMDSYSMNSVLRALRGDQWRLAFQMRKEMELLGVPADIITFNTLLNATGLQLYIYCIHSHQFNQLNVIVLSAR